MAVLSCALYVNTAASDYSWCSFDSFIYRKLSLRGFSFNKPPLPVILVVIIKFALMLKNSDNLGTTTKLSTVVAGVLSRVLIQSNALYRVYSSTLNSRLSPSCGEKRTRPRPRPPLPCPS